jgi:hypothetical protein
MYSFDTSAFMDWQARYYPLDVFRSLETRLEALIAEGRCQAVALVHDEIRSVGTPGLQAWAKAHKTLFVPLSPEVQALEPPSRPTTRTSWTRRVSTNPLTRT